MRRRYGFHPACICMSGTELQRGILHARNMQSYRKGSPLEPGLVARKWLDAHVQGADNAEVAVSDGCSLTTCKPYHGDATIIADGEAKIFLCKEKGRCFVQPRRSVDNTRCTNAAVQPPHLQPTVSCIRGHKTVCVHADPSR